MRRASRSVPRQSSSVSGRHVRQGEKGIKIRGFSTRKVTDTDPDTGEEAERTIATYPILTVFDVSQTDPNTEVTDYMRKKNPNTRLWADIETPVRRLRGDDSADIYTRTAEYITHRGRCEVEAESVAYIVAGILGLDTTDYSIGYIASWAEGDPQVIAETATNVLEVARRITAALDPETDNQDDDEAAA